MNTYGIVVGRALIGLLFVVAGVGKAMGVDATTAMIDASGLPFAALLAYLTIIIEIVGGAALILGWKAKYAAGVLIVFTVVATLIYHTDFPEQMMQFLKNAAVIGGLLYVHTYGAGKMALDR